MNVGVVSDPTIEHDRADDEVMAVDLPPPRLVATRGAVYRQEVQPLTVGVVVVLQLRDDWLVSMMPAAYS